MKLTMFSNFLNAHQLPLCNQFAAMDDVEFTFVSLLNTDGVVGRLPLDDDYSYVLKEYEDNSKSAMDHAISDDVVIFGDMAGKEQYVRARAKTGKLFFRYAERLLKRGDWWRFFPLKIYRTWNMFGRYKSSNMYVLCASAYTARDLSLFGFPSGKCLKWGYFPELPAVQRCDRINQSEPIKMCSVQRLIPLKRVDWQIRLAAELKANGYRFCLRVAGDGPDRARLEELIENLKVSDCVTLLGELDKESVADLMSSSDIFLATSNRKEGWGATINEAMAAGCCVVASDEMGSVPFLINNGLNGVSVHIDDGDMLYRLITALFNNPDTMAKMGIMAKKTIEDTWNAQEARKRFVTLSNGLRESRDLCNPVDGPLSKA